MHAWSGRARMRMHPPRRHPFLSPLQGEFTEDWGPDEPRNNRLIFIGKNLNRVVKRTVRGLAVTPQRMFRIHYKRFGM